MTTENSEDSNQFLHPEDKEEEEEEEELAPDERLTEELEPPIEHCLLYTSPSPRDQRGSRMPSSA